MHFTLFTAQHVPWLIIVVQNDRTLEKNHRKFFSEPIRIDWDIHLIFVFIFELNSVSLLRFFSPFFSNCIASLSPGTIQFILFKQLIVFLFNMFSFFIVFIATKEVNSGKSSQVDKGRRLSSSLSLSATVDFLSFAFVTLTVHAHFLVRKLICSCISVERIQSNHRRYSIN